MRRTIAVLLIAFSPLLGTATSLHAQSLSADRFLEGVSAHFVDDQAEQGQAAKIYQALSTAPPAEAERELQTLLQYSRSGNEEHGRPYATLFLTAIAIRPDGPNLLSSKSEQLSSLIVDTDPGIQEAAINVMTWVIWNPRANKQYFVSALKTAIQMPQTT
jgi:hypothetical protein